MAVTYSSNIVIKSSYKEGKTPAEYMGIELTFGKNTFSSLKDAEDFINLGATRLGTSRIVKIAKNEENNSNY